MFNRKGEISTIFILGTLVVIGVAALFGSTVNNNRNTLDTKAAGTGACRNNPVDPPEGGYTWVADCNKSCNTNTDCPQNTADINVNSATSNWCYGFDEGAKCMQLQKGTNVGSSVGTQPNPASGTGTTGFAICDKVGGCGGACNPNINSGCGYYGCRFWEYCSPSGTCIDTTGGTSANPPRPDACLSKSDAGGANVLPNTSVPTATPVANNSNPTQIISTPLPTPTPTRYNLPNGTSCIDGSTCQSGCCSDRFCNSANVCENTCNSGQIKCFGTDLCVDSRTDCPKPSPTRIPTYAQQNDEYPLTITAAPTYVQQNDQYSSTITPSPVPTPLISIGQRIQAEYEIIRKSCQQGPTFELTDITHNCIVDTEPVRNFLNSLNIK